MWFRDFHIDGLRLDAVHALFDERAITLLEELSAEVATLSTSSGRPMWLIAESDRNDPLTVTPREAGGLGLHAQWADDVHHALHVLLTGETQGYYADFAAPGALTKVLEGVFLHDGTYSSFRRRTHGRPIDRTRTPGWRFVVSLQTHDQVGNRAVGDRLPADAHRVALAVVLFSLNTPLLFMGEEHDETAPFQFFTDHIDPFIADATREGRKREFASFASFSGEEVPDPQAEATFERSRISQPAPDPFYAELIRLRRELPRTLEVSAEGHVLTMRRGAATLVADFDARTVELER
jgi:maltooligosyltrehalose trehalohydrolase